MSLIHVTGPEQFSTEVENFSGTVLVDFWAPRCMPCKMLGPIIEEVALDNQNNANVKVVKVDVEDPQNQMLAMKYQIVSIPSVYVFNGGKAVDNLIGLREKEAYQHAISRFSV